MYPPHGRNYARHRRENYYGNQAISHKKPKSMKKRRAKDLQLSLCNQSPGRLRETHYLFFQRQQKKFTPLVGRILGLNRADINIDTRSEINRAKLLHQLEDTTLQHGKHLLWMDHEHDTGRVVPLIFASRDV